MKTLMLAATLAAGLPMAASALTITANQGQRFDGTDVKAERSDLNNMFDGVATNQSIYSMGFGGFVSASVDPNRLANPMMVIEITNDTPNASYPESVDLFLGGGVSGVEGLDDGNAFDNASATHIGSLANDGVLTATALNGAVITKTQDSMSSSFTINIANVGDGLFDRLTLVDTSGNARATADGFDIGELTVNAVPLPASAVLLISGLAGFGFMSRRRRNAA